MDAIEPDDLPGRIGCAIETAHDPVGEIHVHHDPDLGHVEILYVAADPFPPPDFWAMPGRGRLVDRSQASAPLVLPLRLSDEGAEISVVAGDPDGAARKALVPPDHLVRAHREGRLSFGDLLLWGEREVAAYDAWRRGEVYGIVRESLSLSSGSSGLPDVQATWSVLDLEGAERALREAVDRREGELAAASAPRP